MPVELAIPGRESIVLKHAVFDVNGTLAVDGELIEGVSERLGILAGSLTIHMITADTHGKQHAIDDRLGITAVRMTPGHEREQKAEFINRLDRHHCAAVGNGANDVLMLETAVLGIAVLGHEGLYFEAARAADVLAPSILDALDMLIHPARLVATLRR
jgi:P-type E1-E2 ATPase